MALTRPFINNFPAFDATEGTTAYISVLGGDAIDGYSFKIFSGQSSEPIYESPKNLITGDISSTNIRSFPISIETSMGLTNNNSYTIQPTTYNGNDSQVGTGTIFTCYKTPTIRLLTQSSASDEYVQLDKGVMLNSVSPLLRFTFNANDLNSIAQPNNLELTIYGVNDDDTKDIVFKSGTLYTFARDTITNTYSADITGGGITINVDAEGKLLPLTERRYKSFSFAVKCTTIENMVIDRITIEKTEAGVTTTELVDEVSEINCHYETISNSPNLVVTNLCDEGKVRIISTFTDIEGTSYPTPPTYIDNQEVDLTGTNHWAKWEKAFSVRAPYTVRLWARDLNVGEILSLTTETSTRQYIKLKYNIEDDEAFISLESGFTLKSSNTIGPLDEVNFSHPYYIESQRIAVDDITSTTNLFIGIQSQEGLYDLDFEVLGAYFISTTLTNVSGNTSNPTKILGEHTATLKFSADYGYTLPDTITVTGATLVSWSQGTGTAVISNPTGNVNISIIGEELTFDPVLSENDWAIIKTVCQADSIPETWADATKTFVGKDDNTYTIRLSDKQAGRYTYADNSRVTHGVFEFVNLPPDTYQWNSTATNEGGFADCLIQTTLNNTIINILPDEIKDLLEEIIVKSGTGGTTYTGQSTSVNKLFLPARGEVLLTVDIPQYQDETKNGDVEFGRYDYYVNHFTSEDRQKYQVGTTTPKTYCLRSPTINNENNINKINQNGVRLDDLANNEYYVAPVWAW